MRLYHYDPATGQFAGEGTAQPNPVEKGKYLIPAFSTTIAPPQVGEGEEAVFNGAKWTVKKLPALPPRTAQQARADKITEIRGKAQRLLYPGDVKVQRHMEQLTLGCATSITEDEYMGLLTTRQQVRDRSNFMEKEVAALPDMPEVIDAYVVRY